MTTQALTLVIGTKNLSSWSLRPWLALKVAGIPFEEVEIALDQPGTAQQIARHSPAGLVPVLKHGDLTVWDSLAIVEYVNETVAAGGLWPKDPAARARARAMAAEMHSGFADLRRTMPLAVAEDRTPHEPSPGAAKDIARIIALWTEARAGLPEGAGPFLCGGFTAVDAFYAPVVSRFRTYGVDLPPVARAYADAIWSLPAMQDWLDASRR